DPGHGGDAADLVAQRRARQAVGWNSEGHHASGFVGTLTDLDVMAHTRRVVGAGQPARPGSHNQNLPAARRCDRHQPALVSREIAEETLYRVDCDRCVQRCSVAAAFAGVIAGSPMRRRKRVVIQQRPPRLFIFSGLSLCQPSLDILSGRASVVTWRKKINIDGPLPTLTAHTPARRLL